jgi:hypothetical protein
LLVAVEDPIPRKNALAAKILLDKLLFDACIVQLAKKLFHRYVMAGHITANIAAKQIQEFSRPQYLTPPNFGDNPQPSPPPAARKRKLPDE